MKASMAPSDTAAPKLASGKTGAEQMGALVSGADASICCIPSLHFTCEGGREAVQAHWGW